MPTARQRAMSDPQVQAAILAAKFAREMGLPQGNLWEPGAARNMARDLEECTFESVEAHYRFRFFGDEG